MKKQVLLMDAKDNVAIVVNSVTKGDIITLEASGDSFPALEDIPRSHKIAIQNIGEREQILRYGEPIGYATKPIRQGEWVHIHNLDAYQIM